MKFIFRANCVVVHYSNPHRTVLDLRCVRLALHLEILNVNKYHTN